MRTDDWEVNSEGDLQRAIHEWLAHRFPAYLILKGGDLDFTLVAPPPRTPAVCFIECKAYTGQRPGGMGFGNQLGQGAQVELLLEPWLSMPMVRWCFADLTRPAGDARYALLTSGRARRCARGEVSRGKQNNFRIKDALRQPLKRAVLLDRIERFVSAVRRTATIKGARPRRTARSRPTSREGEPSGPIACWRDGLVC